MLRVITEKRSGKMSTIIYDADDRPIAESKDLAKTLKSRLAVGGSERDGEILLQGDVKDKAIALLVSLGYKAR